MTAKEKSPESVVRDIQRKTRRVFNAEEKIRIILEGLKGEDSIAAICRREGIHPTSYDKWSKDFLEPKVDGSIEFRNVTFNYINGTHTRYSRHK